MKGGRAVAAPSWVLRKIALPGLEPGHLQRAELVERALPTQRPLTVLLAGGGFGKTTLLAECCQRLRDEAVATAWISIDRNDDAESLETCIAFACRTAGLPLDVGAAVRTDAPESRLELVLSEIQGLGGPFVMAFDEAESLGLGAAAVLENVLRRGPPNLHVAMACRRLPAGVNVASAIVEGRVSVIGTEELRFLPADAARLFEVGPSRRALAEEIERADGWPLALRIARNQMVRGTAGTAELSRVLTGNWIDDRLLAVLSPENRDFVLDLGLFEWFDPALADEVLRRTDSRRRLESMDELAGLVTAVGGGAEEVRRLHGLVREHCADRRFRETPERFRALHRRIAEALARRGETIPAMRHAVEGGKASLAGDILLRAGGVRLWTQHGVVTLCAANRLLGEEEIAARPRLALVRCGALALTGNVDEARSRYRDIPIPGSTGGTVPDDDAFDHTVDDCILRMLVALTGVETYDSPWLQALKDDIARLADVPRLDPPTRGFMAYAMCVLHHLTGEFDAARDRLDGARQFLERSTYMRMFAEMLRGEGAMAQGDVAAAEAGYGRARRLARRRFPLDSAPAAFADAAIQELALECDCVVTQVKPGGVPTLWGTRGVTLSGFAAAAGVAIERRLREGRADDALATADEWLDAARAAGRPALVRLLTASRVSVLVAAGRAAEAERDWKRAGLVEEPEACVDLDCHLWRDMEAVACARLRLLTARGRFPEARRLFAALDAVAEARRLVRTRMRALALAVALEWCADATVAALRHLDEYLRLFARSPYAWPLVRERTACEPAVRRFLASRRGTPARAARALLTLMHPADTAAAPKLTRREKQVLRLLPGRRDREIAEALGVTHHAVRHHLRRVFAILDVKRRADAIDRARELGIVPDDP